MKLSLQKELAGVLAEMENTAKTLGLVTKAGRARYPSPKCRSRRLERLSSLRRGVRQADEVLRRMWKGYGMSRRRNALASVGMRILGLLVLVCCALPSAKAAIDGTITNGTTGKPQAGRNHLLVKPGQQAECKRWALRRPDQQGHFQFTHDQPGGGPQLLQADYEGVNYNKLLTPNMPTSGVDVRVYNATKSPAQARIMQHMIVLEPGDAETSVSETFVLQNSSNETLRKSRTRRRSFLSASICRWASAGVCAGSGRDAAAQNCRKDGRN